jgi:hypothetical protein
VHAIIFITLMAKRAGKKVIILFVHTYIWDGAAELRKTGGILHYAKNLTPKKILCR